MIRITLRIIGFWLLALAFVALVLDGARTVTSGALVITPLGETWFDLSPGSLNLMQAVIQRNLHPYIWDPVVQWILLSPTWLITGLIALLLLALGKKRRGIVEV